MSEGFCGHYLVFQLLDIETFISVNTHWCGYCL